jgi:hypothetical protein
MIEPAKHLAILELRIGKQVLRHLHQASRHPAILEQNHQIPSGKVADTSAQQLVQLTFVRFAALAYRAIALRETSPLS